MAEPTSWQRLCPQPVGDDPVLAAAAQYLGEPATAALLDELDAARAPEGARSSLLLTEPGIGSNLLRAHTRAERGTLDAQGVFAPAAAGQAATHYRLSGEKSLINGGGRHELLVTLARAAEAGQAQ